MSFTFKRPEVFHTPIQRVLDFDVEARPLGWIGGDYVHKEVTAIGWAWIENGEPVDLECAQINKDYRSHKKMLKRFRDIYDQADMVTGHFIRGFDLALVNGAMAEFDLPLLDAKLAHDTKLDLVKHSGMSKSQENMSDMHDLEQPKVKMTVPKWREANRLTKRGMELTEERVLGDVVQHVEMREWMLAQGLLGPPKMWVPGGSGQEAGYTP